MGPEQIAEVVARATGIPVSSLMAGERDKLLHMETVLAEQVVGQDEALLALTLTLLLPLTLTLTRSWGRTRRCVW